MRERRNSSFSRAGEVLLPSTSSSSSKGRSSKMRKRRSAKSSRRQVMPSSPELLYRVVEEAAAFDHTDKGASGRTARIFWAREQMMSMFPGRWSGTDAVRNELVSGECPQPITDCFMELMVST